MERDAILRKQAATQAARRAHANVQRQAALSANRGMRSFNETPLMKIGTWMQSRRITGHEDSIQGAPQDLLEEAHIHIERRLIAIALQRGPSARTRSTERWLGRWMQIVESEMRRQQPRCCFETI